MKNSRMLRFVAGWIAVLGAAFACAESSPDVETLLKKMRVAYSSMPSAVVRSQSSFNGPQGNLQVKLTTSYKKSNKVHISMVGAPGTRPGSKVVLCTDGKSIQLLGHPAGDREQKFSLQNLGSGSFANLEVICMWDWARQLSTDKGANMHDSKLKVVKGVAWNGSSWTVLEETAGNVFVRYFIDPNTNLIHRTVVINPKTNKPVSEHVIQSLKREVKIDDKLFRLKKIAKKIDA